MPENPRRKGGEEKVAANNGPQLVDYLQAGYPCLFLPTVEPEVAEARVRAALLELGLGSLPFGSWKITTGLVVGSVDGTTKKVKKADDLLDALVLLEQQEEPMILVIHNARKHLPDPANEQALIDAVFAARLVGSHIVLIGPVLDLPPELRTLVTFVDCPLPKREKIEEEYRKMIAAYKSEIKDLPKTKSDLDRLFRDASTAAVGLDLMGAENAISLSLASKETIDISIIQAQKEQEVRKSDVLEFVPVEETMDNVGGFAEFKEYLKKRSKAFSDEAKEYGLPFPRGFLFVGPAGTGKSLVAKAVAHYLRIPCLRMDMGKIFRSLMGESEAAIRLALQVAEAVSPVALWIDEINQGMAGMRGSGELDSGVTARVVSTILTWRQETKSPVVLVATANDVATIPSMVYRRGRLDEVWATDLPNETEREEIFRIHLRKRGRNPDVFTPGLLAARASQFVGSEIESAIEDAMFSAFSNDAEVNDKYILQAIAETVPQADRDKEEITAIREWVASRARLVSGGEEESVQGVPKVRALRKKTTTKK
jgi:ATP-dependent 26S proteasome regulatory subunit